MIDGTYSIFYVKSEGTFLPIGLLISDSFTEDVEMLNTTTRDNNGWKTERPTSQNYNISIDGLLVNTNFSGGDFTKISLDKLKVLKRNRTLVQWKTQQSGSIIVESSGYGYIISLSKSVSTEEFVSFNCEIEGFGALLT